MGSILSQNWELSSKKNIKTTNAISVESIFLPKRKKFAKTISAERTLINTFIYTISTKRRSKNETQTWLDERSEELQVCGAFWREPFWNNYVFKIYFTKFFLVHISLCKILLQNFVENFLDYLPIAYVKCLLWKIIHPLIDL